MEGEKSCAICHMYHHIPEVFPEDFPYEWRWCCGCSIIGELIIEDGIESARESFEYDPGISRRVEKINKMINVG